jgi:hypothetical protein
VKRPEELLREHLKVDKQTSLNNYRDLQDYLNQISNTGDRVRTS